MKRQKGTVKDRQTDRQTDERTDLQIVRHQTGKRACGRRQTERRSMVRQNDKYLDSYTNG